MRTCKRNLNYRFLFFSHWFFFSLNASPLGCKICRYKIIWIQFAVGVVFRNYMTSIVLYINFAQTLSFRYIYRYHNFKIVHTQSVKVCSYWLWPTSSVVVRRSASLCDKASLHLGPQILPWPSIDQATNYYSWSTNKNCDVLTRSKWTGLNWQTSRRQHWTKIVLIYSAYTNWFLPWQPMDLYTLVPRRVWPSCNLDLGETKIFYLFSSS